MAHRRVLLMSLYLTNFVEIRKTLWMGRRMDQYETGFIRWHWPQKHKIKRWKVLVFFTLKVKMSYFCTFTWVILGVTFTST